MSDRHIQEAKRTAEYEQTLEAWLQYEMVLERFGQGGQECFNNVLEVYAKELARLKINAEAVKKEAGLEAQRCYQIAFGEDAGMVCGSCRGTKYTWISDRDQRCDCSTSNKPKVFKPMYGKYKPFWDFAWKDFKEAYDEAMQIHKEAGRDFRARRNATLMTVGAMVIYNNPKARAKFKAPDGKANTTEKVPCYTYGIVSKTFHNGFGNQINIKTSEGKVFSSTSTNFSKEVLNSMYRYRQIDPVSQATLKEKRIAEEEWTNVKKIFDSGLSRGMEVTYLNIPVKVIWVGKDKTGRPRVGIKATRRSSPIFINATEITPV